MALSCTAGAAHVQKLSGIENSIAAAYSIRETATDPIGTRKTLVFLDSLSSLIYQQFSSKDELSEAGI
jgi:hypothetical protein